jgi:ornithine cyclodeaminase/alanine dehydrogenase-like protein (mu-crystallin family)
MAPPPPTYWELRFAVRSHRWAPSVELWQCCADYDDGTCDEEPFLVFSASGLSLGDALSNAAAMAAKVKAP